MTDFKPRQQAPSLEVDTLSGTRWKLYEKKPENFIMIVFYRGLHCPICRNYLRDLDRKIGEFLSRDVEVIAASSDSQQRAQTTQREWELQSLNVGYGLTIPKAREWGLYISRGIKDGEPPEFAEPGLFLVKPDGTLYAAAINTMPFARPSFNDVLGAIDFVIQHNYPARGEA